MAQQPTNNDTRQYGLDGPFHAWESDHTALVHVLWAAKGNGLDLHKDADEVASAILGSRWHAATKNAAQADAWTAGRESIGTHLVDNTGKRPVGANPHTVLPADAPRTHRPHRDA